MKPAIIITCILLGIFGGRAAAAPLAGERDKFLGNILKHTAEEDEDFLTYWNQASTENSGKWGTVEKNRDEMDWSKLDFIYEHTRDHGIPMKSHTFIWATQQPDWIMDLPPDEQREEVEEWIAAFGARYPDAEYIDVVNEPFNQPAPYREALGGKGETGWDWVIWAFEKARQYCPNSKLLINEHSILNNTYNTSSYLSLTAVLGERGLIDGIGVQGHWLENADPETIRYNLGRLYQSGLPVYVTELDISVSNDDQQQAVYEKIFPVLWEHPAVRGITLWGYKQGKIWRGDAFLLKSDGAERPALAWLRDYLASNPAETAQAPSSPGGTPWPASPGQITRIEAEGYDSGGEGLAYHDFTIGNQGEACRQDDVDIAAFADKPGACYVNRTLDGEWLEYTIAPAVPGKIILAARVSASRTATGKLRVSLSGRPAATADVPLTGDDEAFTTILMPLGRADAEIQVLRLEMENGRFNLDWIELLREKDLLQVKPAPDGNGAVLDLLVPTGFSYSIQTSADGRTWEDGGAPRAGTGAAEELVFAEAGETTLFRLIETDGAPISPVRGLRLNEAEAFFQLEPAVQGWLSWGGGWLYAGCFPWVWHPRHHWWFLADGNADGFWLYDGRLEWLWTSDAAYPFLYWPAVKNWVWFAGREGGIRLFYCYAASKWLRIEDD